jgi:hypothetical protein
MLESGMLLIYFSASKLSKRIRDSAKMPRMAIYDAEAGWYPTHEERIAIEDAYYGGARQYAGEFRESDYDESEESDYDESEESDYDEESAAEPTVPVRDPTPPPEANKTVAQIKQANYDRDFAEIYAQALREEAAKERRQNKLNGVR